MTGWPVRVTHVPADELFSAQIQSALYLDSLSFRTHLNKIGTGGKVDELLVVGLGRRVSRNPSEPRMAHWKEPVVRSQYAVVCVPVISQVRS